MAAGSLDGNGVWIYGEGDPASPVSDLLNLGMDSVSDTVGDAKARLTALETDTSVWTDVAFDSGFQSYSGNTIEVRKIGLVVYMRGLLQRTSGSFANSTQYGGIIIPDGFRPTWTTFCVVGSTIGQGASTLVILSSGATQARISDTGGGAYI